MAFNIDIVKLKGTCTVCKQMGKESLIPKGSLYWYRGEGMGQKKFHFACHVANARAFSAHQEPSAQVLAQIRAFPVDFKIKVLSAYANQRQAIRDLQTGAGRPATYEIGTVVDHPALPVVPIKKKRIAKPIEGGGGVGVGVVGGSATKSMTLEGWELVGKRREIEQLQAQLDAINKQFPDARDEIRVVEKEVKIKEVKGGKGDKKAAAAASSSKASKKKKRVREEEEEEEDEEEEETENGDEEYDDGEEEAEMDSEEEDQEEKGDENEDVADEQPPKKKSKK